MVIKAIDYVITVAPFNDYGTASVYGFDRKETLHQ